MTGLAVILLALLLLPGQVLARDTLYKREFNTNAFTGLNPAPTVSYESATLDYDLENPAKALVHFTSCKQVELTDEADIIEHEFNLLWLLKTNCNALKRYSSSQRASQSFFPPRLTKELVTTFPATAAPVINDDDMRERQGKTLAKFEKGMRISITPQGEAKVITSTDRNTYIVMARADFDGDGIEDLLVRVDWAVRDAFGKGHELVLLSKKSRSGPVTEIWRQPSPSE